MECSSKLIGKVKPCGIAPEIECNVFWDTKTNEVFNKYGDFLGIGKMHKDGVLEVKRKKYTLR